MITQLVCMFASACLWVRDIRRIGKELQYRDKELLDPYGLEYHELRPLPLWRTHPHHEEIDT